MANSASDDRASAPSAGEGSGYGWTSILLHWTSAVAILVLLFSGDTISVSGLEALRVHTTMGLCVWLLLAARIWWRAVRGHPARSAQQGAYSFMVGAVVHYLLLVGIAVMIASGPVAGWSSGRGLAFFEVTLPGSTAPLPAVHEAALGLHRLGAWMIGLGTLAHLLGVLKHVMIDRDSSFERIMVANANPEGEKK